MKRCIDCDKKLANIYAKQCRECYLKSVPKGENHQGWKGDEIGYGGVHQWMQKKYGSPIKCDKCGTEKAKRYEWANISRKYKRERSDFEGLCASCHRRDGFEKGEYTSWIKGTHRQTNTGKTHIKKGQRLSPKTEFKKGFVPWNKYLQPKICQRCGTEFQPKNAKNASKYCSQKCYWNH